MSAPDTQKSSNSLLVAVDHILKVAVNHSTQADYLAVHREAFGELRNAYMTALGAAHEPQPAASKEKTYLEVFKRDDAEKPWGLRVADERGPVIELLYSAAPIEVRQYGDAHEPETAPVTARQSKIIANFAHATLHILDDWAEGNAQTGDVNVEIPADQWKELNRVLDLLGDDPHAVLHRSIGIELERDELLDIPDFLRNQENLAAERASQPQADAPPPEPVLPPCDDALPCAHCGARPFVEVIPAHEHTVAKFMPPVGDTWTIECSGCEAGFCGGTREDVLAAWNRRAAQPPSVDWQKRFNDAAEIVRIACLKHRRNCECEACYWLGISPMAQRQAVESSETKEV